MPFLSLWTRQKKTQQTNVDAEQVVQDVHAQKLILPPPPTSCVNYIKGEEWILKLQK